ncbi:MAG TPA: peptidoglycan DD-metalloendopeptidase family protein [Gemmatimonadota bacterium]|nr:peptidoglycan DD-metalloendopeptidase family protein [Gemmatimonadota bacterium]
MRRFALAATVLLGLVAGAVSLVSAQDVESELEAQRARLERLQQEIRQKREEAARLGRQESSVLQELRRVENEIGLTRELVTTLEDEIEQRSQQIESTTEELARAQDELAVKRQILARRLRTIYKLGSFGNFQVLLMADSFAEILGRYKYLRLVAEQDRRLLARIERLENTIRRNRSQLEEARTGLAEAREERVEQVQSLSVTERDRERALTQVKSRRSEQLEAAAALEAETRRIQSLLTTLERRRTEREELARREAEEAGRDAPAPAASTLTGDFGALDWPVDGEIVERFGRSRHPVYNTEVVNNGIDIRAARGTPVRAVEAGEVVYADFNGGYGLMIIVDHDGGDYSLYAHLDRAAVSIGQRVAKGSSIGTVGESGSLVGPKLHFEIRQGGRAVDPIGWLRRR